MRQALRTARSITMASAVVVALAAGVAKPQTPSPASSARPLAPREVLAGYCFGCHNERLRTANLALDAIEGPETGSHAETWEKVVRKLRTRTMPPIGARRPDESTYDALVASLEGARG